MLRIIQNSHVAGAKSYYSTADYYSEGQELIGQYRGKGARLLGLPAEVEKQSWDALCDNLHPATGRKLTPRVKDHRTVGYDFNFHVPKSISLLYGITRDERILDAFRDAMQETMGDIESEAKTRVRVRGQNEDRVTGNLAWGEFVHFTSRPVDGIPDPQLHGHCFVFNITHDDAEDRWKAGQFRDLKRDAPYFQAVYHARLAENLKQIGLPIERTAKGWEIAGLSASTLNKFSRRTQQIEELAREKGIVDPEQKAELGAKTRQKKQKHLSADELRQDWASRLTPDEGDALARLHARVGTQRLPVGDPVATREAVQHAVEHLFERKSVVSQRTLIAAALQRGIGEVTPEGVRKEIDRQGLITATRSGQVMVTTREVLAEEKRMLDFAREGRGACRPLANSPHVIQRDWLNQDQRASVQHVLSSRDRVILIRGAAGVGKTSAMQETVEAIEHNGKQVFTFAPSAGASRGVLRENGFAAAETVARLLVDEPLQQQAAGQVLWIDEAGLLGSRTMAQVIDLADRLDCRLVLQGDTAQHGSVERGSPLRLLEERAGLRPARIKEILRQDGAYKEAVRALSEGRVLEGFDRLDDLHWIKEVPVEERYRLMAEDYVATLESGQSCLVVSPTHSEGRKITEQIRRNLRDKHRLGEEEHSFTTLENTGLTTAERRDPAQVGEDAVIVFHQNAKGGYRRGQRLKAGRAALPLGQAERFQVFREKAVTLSAGDVIRITRNGRTADNKHDLHNGMRYGVKGFTPGGDIILDNRWVVAKDFGHLAPGYCVTSMASQGKDYNVVLVGQSQESYPASSPEQFYVSASRGQKACRIYCDNKADLREAVSRSEDRLTATELVSPTGRLVPVRHRQQQQAAELRARGAAREREALAHER